MTERHPSHPLPEPSEIHLLPMVINSASQVYRAKVKEDGAEEYEEADYIVLQLVADIGNDGMPMHVLLSADKFLHMMACTLVPVEDTLLDMGHEPGVACDTEEAEG